MSRKLALTLLLVMLGLASFDAVQDATATDPDDPKVEAKTGGSPWPE